MNWDRFVPGSTLAYEWFILVLEAQPGVSLKKDTTPEQVIGLFKRIGKTHGARISSDRLTGEQETVPSFNFLRADFPFNRVPRKVSLRPLDVWGFASGVVHINQALAGKMPERHWKSKCGFISGEFPAFGW